MEKVINSGRLSSSNNPESGPRTQLAKAHTIKCSWFYLLHMVIQTTFFFFKMLHLFLFQNAA